jgi:transcriptional regulator with XRE-family HTH domain
MTEISQLIETIKRQLKLKGLTYRDVAEALDISEPSVKRLFSTKRLTVERLAQLSELLEFTLSELLQEAAATRLRLHTLSKSQEAQLVSDEPLLLVTVCALNHWSLADIVAAYRLTKTECLKHLLVLDRMGMIELLPGDRIRLLVARDFDWLKDGPIQRFFLGQGIGDFMGSKFDREEETMEFVSGMLTTPAFVQLQLELRRVRSRLAALHEESAVAPLAQRRGVGLLLAMREWEPSGFKQLRREAEKRDL